MSVSNLLVANNNSIFVRQITADEVLTGGITASFYGNEIDGSTTISGALAVTNGFIWRIRKTGRWISITAKSVAGSTASGGTAATIASFIPLTYRPLTTLFYIGMIKSNGVDMAGKFTINTDGSMSVGELANGFFAAGLGQIYSFSCEYTIY